MAIVTGHKAYGGKLAHNSVGLRRARCVWVAIPALAILSVVAVAPAAAQIVPTPNPGRDCQTVRTCNFSRSGAYRGCLSSYTCRICKTVRSRCSIGRRSQVCERIVCSWGG
jgi:hypothetical protein